MLSLEIGSLPILQRAIGRLAISRDSMTSSEGIDLSRPLRETAGRKREQEIQRRSTPSELIMLSSELGVYRLFNAMEKELQTKVQDQLEPA